MFPALTTRYSLLGSASTRGLKCYELSAARCPCVLGQIPQLRLPKTGSARARIWDGGGRFASIRTDLARRWYLAWYPARPPWSSAISTRDTFFLILAVRDLMLHSPAPSLGNGPLPV
ncbi:hypothetical protein BDZ89DRAFT_700537 [Hymenopellis radicata]|nr:hypothetical protein BDZ89DRAFT_700537 [Hymenopellis radicata]